MPRRGGLQRDSQGLDLLLPRGHADPELSQARAVCPAQDEKNGQFGGKTAQERARVWISRVRLTPLSPAFSHTVGRAEFNHQFLLSKGIFSSPSSSNLAVSSLKTGAARLGAASPPLRPSAAFQFPAHAASPAPRPAVARRY